MPIVEGIEDSTADVAIEPVSDEIDIHYISCKSRVRNDVKEKMGIAKWLKSINSNVGA